MVWRGSTTAQDRVLACLPYLLVLFYAYPFGVSLLDMVPGLATVFSALLAPVLSMYVTFPLADLVVFLVLFLLVVRNERILHFIRFNTMQALIMGFAIRLVSLLFDALGLLPNEIFVLQIVVNAVFLAAVAAVGYSVVQSGRGLYAEIPTISNAAYVQVR